MKNLIVTSTRKTSQGTFRPGVLYAIDDTKPEGQAVLNSLVEGKDGVGRKLPAEPVGKILTDAQAEQFRKDRAQLAAAEKAEELSDPATRDDVQRDSILERAVDAEAKVEALKKELGQFERKAFDREAVITNAQADLHAANTKVGELTDALADAEKKSAALAEQLAKAEAKISDLEGGDAKEGSKPSKGASK